MPKNIKLALQIGSLLAVIGLALYLAHLASGNEAIQEIVGSYGYIGIFVISLVSGFNLFVPIPAASLIPLFVESGLSFWLTILIITLGVTAADAIAYILAKAGKRIASESLGEKFFEKFHGLREKYYRSPLAFLFIFASLAPLPNEILVVPAAFLGYPFRQVIPVVLAGNLVFNILFSKGLLNIFNIL